MKIPFHHSDSKNCHIPDIPPIHCKVEILCVESELVDGKVVSHSVYKTDDSEHRFDGMKASDFFLENQLAAGVDLRSAFVRPSTFDMIDGVENNVVKMVNMIEKAS